MWYKENGDELDYNRPIIAIAENNDIMLLLPQIAKSDNHIPGLSIDYDLIGYNWFNIRTGKYNSQFFWKDPENAVNSYKNKYEVRNADINIK